MARAHSASALNIFDTLAPPGEAWQAGLVSQNRAMGPWHENSFMVTTGIAEGARLKARHGTKIPLSLLSRHMQMVGQRQISIVSVSLQGADAVRSFTAHTQPSTPEAPKPSKSAKQERWPRRRKKASKQASK